MLNYNERTQMYNIGVAIHSAAVQYVLRMPINTIEEIDAKSVLIREADVTNSAICTGRMNSIWRV